MVSRTGPGLSDTLTYDGAGRIVDASHPDGLVHHVYDGLGRVDTVTWPGGLTVGYEYDGASNLTSLTYPDGSKVTYIYDQLNRLTQILDDAVPANVLAAYQYDAHSRRTLLTLNNGVTSAYTYTKDNEVLNLVHTWTGGDATYIYGFDGNGRRTNLRISNDSFDPWLTVTPSLTLTANNLNQLTSIGGTPLGYDLNGNLLNDGTHVYTHDAVNRLVDVDGTIAYTYDTLGRRVSKTISGVVTKYVYDGARVIAEYDGASQLLRKYIYGPGLDEPVMMQVSAARYYYLFDSLGSVIGLTDASGTLVESYRYNVYGQPLQASTVGNPYMFTGRRFDSETGLYYYRNRYYSPQLRRFIEPDPIGFEGGMNLYAYVGNDPGNAVDPWGLLLGGLIPAGESYGSSSAQYWADRQVATGNPLYAIPGLLASLWTPCTSDRTFLTLASGATLGALTKGASLSKFFWNSNTFPSISRAYWGARGGAGGMSLDHWFFSQAAVRSGAVPAGLANGGWNLFEMPMWMNSWLGLAPNWGGMQAVLARMARLVIQIGVPASAVASGYAGYQAGSAAIEPECDCQ